MRQYKRLLVSRPIFPMGKDLGYQPGSGGEMLDLRMQPIHNALSLIVHNRTGNTNTQNKKAANLL